MRICIRRTPGELKLNATPGHEGLYRPRRGCGTWDQIGDCADRTPIELATNKHLISALACAGNLLVSA